MKKQKIFNFIMSCILNIYLIKFFLIGKKQFNLLVKDRTVRVRKDYYIFKKIAMSFTLASHSKSTIGIEEKLLFNKNSKLHLIGRIFMGNKSFFFEYTIIKAKTE